MKYKFQIVFALAFAAANTTAFGDFGQSGIACGNRGGCYAVTGTISSADVTAAAALTIGLNPKMPLRPQVLLNSSGGDLDAAIAIGRILRQIHATAFIRTRDSCMSACVFLLAGATQRLVGGKVGIHRPYSDVTGLAWISTDRG